MTRPLEELSSSGLHWLINRTVFHPRGYALALTYGDDGKVTGWEIVGNGKEPWIYDQATVDEDALFAAAEATLLSAAKENK